MTWGASPPPSTVGALPPEKGGWGPGGAASGALGLPARLGRDSEPGQADLSQGSESLACPACLGGAGPAGKQPAPWGCPTPGEAASAHAQAPLGGSPRAGSPDPDAPTCGWSPAAAAPPTPRPPRALKRPDSIPRLGRPAPQRPAHASPLPASLWISRASYLTPLPCRRAFECAVPSEGRPALLAPGLTAGRPADALTQPARQPRRDSAPSVCGFQPQFYLLAALWPLGLLPCLNTGTSNSTCPILSVGTTLRGTRKAPSSPGTQKDGDVLESGAQRFASYYLAL